MCLSACAPIFDGESPPAFGPSLQVGEKWLLLANDDQYQRQYAVEIEYRGKILFAPSTTNAVLSLNDRDSQFELQGNAFYVEMQLIPYELFSGAYRVVICRFLRRGNPISNELWVGDAFFGSTINDVIKQMNEAGPYQQTGFCALFRR